MADSRIGLGTLTHLPVIGLNSTHLYTRGARASLDPALLGTKINFVQVHA
jgi:hypothetical protein